jgi:transketolase
MSASPAAPGGAGRPNLEVFADTLLELARGDRDIVVVTGDSRGSGKLAPFAAQLPAQLVEVGIAEQNLVGIAAGLASAGKKVFAVSPACFLTARALEQVKNDAAYSNNPVKLVGISAGVSYGALGATHHSLHDLAALRAIPNIDVVVPADNFETRQAIRAAVGHPRPMYLRFGKAPMPHLYSPDARFTVGRSIAVRSGAAAAFIATGEAVHPAVEAARLLEVEGIRCRVISMHTIKPLDRAAILDAGATGAVVTAEEHSVHGGLGEACAAVLLEAGARCRFRLVGLPDEPTVHGSQREIFEHYGLSGAAMAQTMRRLLGGA